MQRKQITITSKSIFLIDGLGALLSTVMLSCICYFFDGFGVPLNIMQILIAVAACFAFYSLCCYIVVGEKWQLFLTLIIAANMLYSVFTALTVLWFHERISALGIIYFVLELATIYALNYLEIKVLKSKGVALSIKL